MRTRRRAIEEQEAVPNPSERHGKPHRTRAAETARTTNSGEGLARGRSGRARKRTRPQKDTDSPNGDRLALISPAQPDAHERPPQHEGYISDEFSPPLRPSSPHTGDGNTAVLVQDALESTLTHQTRPLAPLQSRQHASHDRVIRDDPTERPRARPPETPETADQENRNPNEQQSRRVSLKPSHSLATAFGVRRPPTATHTYSKRRRTPRVSLPSMQALGVFARSSNSESPDNTDRDNSADNDNPDDESDEYRQDSDESGGSEGDSPAKRDPDLESFLHQQRSLWDEVDKLELQVESD